MSQETTNDLIRWTFTLDSAQLAPIAELLRDYGAEIYNGTDGQVIALWDETDQDLDAVVESLWEAHGSEFEIIHEAFRRVELLEYHHETEPEADTAAA